VSIVPSRSNRCQDTRLCPIPNRKIVIKQEMPTFSAMRAFSRRNFTRSNCSTGFP